MNYLQGFGNQFITESIPNTILPGRNSPQKVPHGLYAEQLSGSAFSMPRSQNFRTWLYRILPSAKQGEFELFVQDHLQSPPFQQALTPPTQLRWDPLPETKQAIDFIDGLYTVAGHGQANALTGSAIHLYYCNQSMTKRFFYNSDGELLLVPQQGKLLLKTEMGQLAIKPREIAVIPRGVKFQVELLEKTARGYVAENFGHPFRLPDLSVIGANGLANPKDFLYPTACYEDKTGEFELITKFQGHLWRAALDHSPLDVVAWYGNYAPYKYDLNLFNVINTVSFDHPDPSIFTVLHSPSEIPGFANLDFVRESVIQ